MSTTTDNYNLVKQTGTEKYDIAVVNANLDKVDAAIKSEADTAETNLQTHEDSTTAHGSDDIVNDSGVAGTKVSDALDTIKAVVDNITTGDSNADIGVYYYNDAVNTDTYIATISGLTLFGGLKLELEIANNNTGASSINLNASGAVAIKIELENGTLRDTFANEIYGICQFTYNGTYWILKNPKEAVGEETLTEQVSIFSTGTGLDESDVSQDYSEVIEDAFAPVKLGGLSLVNSVENGDFSNGTTGWTNFQSSSSVSNNILLNTGNGTGDSGSIYQDTLAENTKIFTYARARVTNSVCEELRIVIFGAFTDTINNPTQNEWYELYGIFNVTTGTPRFQIRHDYADAATANGKVMEVDGNAGVFAINMTALGIEDYTEAQMLDLVRQGYFEGLKSNKNPILCGTNKNQFNKNTITYGYQVDNADGTNTASTGETASDYIRIDDSYDVYISGCSGTSNTDGAYYDQNKTYISGFTSYGSLTIPDGTMYIRFTVDEDDLDTAQLEFDTSATDYVENKTSKLSFKDVTLRRVPNGVFDEIYMG